MKRLLFFLVIWFGFMQLVNSQTNAYEPKVLQFIDKDGYRLKELVIVDQKAACRTYSLESMGGTVTSQEFYVNPDKTEKYKISLSSTWTAQGSAGKLFSKTGATVVCQSLTYTLSVLKEGETVFSRTFAEPNFEFKIIRSIIQGREQTVGDPSIKPDFVSDKNSFSYGGVNFNVSVRFWDGTYIWEPNTRPADAYCTYRINIKLLVL
jgi:hypothetical protein